MAGNRGGRTAGWDGRAPAAPRDGEDAAPGRGLRRGEGEGRALRGNRKACLEWIEAGQLARNGEEEEGNRNQGIRERNAAVSEALVQQHEADLEEVFSRSHQFDGQGEIRAEGHPATGCDGKEPHSSIPRELLLIATDVSVDSCRQLGQ